MSESRITVEEAAHIIQRCTDRIALLLEAESANTGLQSWEEIDTEERRRTIINPLSNIGSSVLMDLEEVYGRNFPENATYYVKKKTQNLPAVEWTGPDLSCELCQPMEELNFLYEVSHSLSFNQSSEAAVRGAFSVIKDVQERLFDILSEFEQEKAE